MRQARYADLMPIESASASNRLQTQRRKESEFLAIKRSGFPPI